MIKGGGFFRKEVKTNVREMCSGHDLAMVPMNSP